MAQRDYILREIERLGEFLAALRRRLLGGGEGGGAAVRTDLESFGQQTGLDPTLLRSMTAETLALVIGGRAGADSLQLMKGACGHRPRADWSSARDPAACWLSAEFLYVDGLTAKAEGDEEAARDRLAKALMLYRLLDGSLASWLEQVPERIAEIERQLTGDWETGGLGDGEKRSSACR